MTGARSGGKRVKLRSRPGVGRRSRAPHRGSLEFGIGHRRVNTLAELEGAAPLQRSAAP